MGDGNTAVVLLHGLYLGPWALRPLARRLRARGFRALPFGYASYAASPSEAAEKLAREHARVEQLHFVAHSLGGLVLRHLLAAHPELPPGRGVTLGTPHQGSAVARHMHGSPKLRWLLGRAFDAGLDGAVPAWPADRELGVVIGTRGPGLGQLIAPLEPPHDGTVEVREALYEPARDTARVPITHTGLLLAPSVAELVARFLLQGSFAGGRSPDEPVGGHRPG